MDAGGEDAIVVDDVAIDEGGAHFVVEGFSFQGRPAALVKDVVFRDSPRIPADDAQVGFVAFAKEATPFDAEEEGWSMAHALNDFLNGEGTPLGKLKHGNKGVLHHGTAAGSFGVGSAFFCDGVGSVVGSDDIQDALIKGFEKGKAVCFCLDGRIPFDEVAFSKVSAVVEPKMVDADFASDSFLRKVTPVEER